MLGKGSYVMEQWNMLLEIISLHLGTVLYFLTALVIILIQFTLARDGLVVIALA